LAFLASLIGSASAAVAACVNATGFRDVPVAGDLCISPVYPGVQGLDTNGDNFGNRCDGDYRGKNPNLGDCSTDVKYDYPEFVKAFRGLTAGADQDHDGNGVVNANDFGLFVGLLGKTPD
jgi:hypothetical protein